MKLQIISRLSKNQKPKYDSIKEILRSKAYVHTQSVQKHESINEYYSINTDWRNEPQQKVEKVNFRQFFNNFNTSCEVKYDPIDFKPQEIKRKLTPILQAKRKTLQLEANFQSKQQSTSKKMSQNQNDLRQNYFSQRAKQKIRKVNSLIAFDYQENANKIESTRKPGFIKQNKSLKKKESSLQISRAAELNKENIDHNDKNKAFLKCGSNTCFEIDDSKERIANIRRELNEIYQMRNRQGQNKLRLN